MRLDRRIVGGVIAVLVAIANPAHSQDLPAAPPAAAPTDPAADSALEAQVRSVAAVLRCPVCQGESILDSPAELAQQMRAVVREQLRAGRTPDQVKAYFVERYGEWILLEPKMTGLNIALYAFPVLLAIGGLAFVAVMVKRWTSRASPDDRSIVAP